MEWQVTPYTIAAAAASGLVLALGALGWRRRPVPGAVEFALFAIAVAVWCLAGALAFADPELPGRILFSKFEYIGVVSAPPLWLACIAACTGVAYRHPTWQLVGLASVPLVTLGLVFSNEQHGLIWSHVEVDVEDGVRVWRATYGPWFWVHSAYSYLVLAGAALLILRQTRRDPYFFRSQGALLLIGMIIPWATNVVYLALPTPFPHVDLTPIGFALGAVAVGAGLVRFGLFDVVPVAREALVEGLPDAVVVLDLRDRVVDVNPAAERLLGQPGRTLLGRPSSDLPRMQALLTAAAGEISEAALRPSQSTTAPDRQFEVERVELTDNRQRPVGRLLVVRDITDRKQIEQERARALRAQMQAAFLEQARQHDRFMAEATRQLTESLDVRATIEVLANLMVPALAAWCSVDAVSNPSGAIQRCVAPATSTVAPHSGEATSRLQLVAHGRPVGVLTWAATAGADASSTHSTIEDLAARAALAIDSAAQYEAERASRAAAEDAVARINRLYDEQQRIVARLLELRGQVEAAERARLLDDERERIARELHDRVEQTFFSIGLSVNALLTNLSTGPVASLRSALEVIRTSAQQGAEDLRAAIFPLSRAEVGDLELVQALSQLVREFQKRTGLEADLAESGRARRVPPEVASALHAVAREGLANVEHHARAAAVVVSLRFEPDALTLTVQDDGVGASALVLSTLADSTTRFGLNASRDRIVRLGGTFSAQPGDEEGFVVRARVPLRDAPGSPADQLQ